MSDEEYRAYILSEVDEAHGDIVTAPGNTHLHDNDTFIEYKRIMEETLETLKKDSDLNIRDLVSIESNLKAAKNLADELDKLEPKPQIRGVGVIIEGTLKNTSKWIEETKKNSKEIE